MGTYTPNYNLYMPSIGEQGWGNLVSNNFEILDTNLNDLQNHIDTIDTQIDTINTQINTINTNIGDGTRILSISTSPIINSENFGKYAFYDKNNVYIAQFYGNITFSSIPQPPHSCRLMIIVANGDFIINGNINIYPKSLRTETPPNSSSTNTYTNTITFTEIPPITLTYTANTNNSQITMDYGDYLNFISNTNIYTNIYTKTYSLSIPHATAAGGVGRGNNGTAASASNTCNGGGGGGPGYYSGDDSTGGTGCIFGQYQGGYMNEPHASGFGYGSGASNKYRCGLVFVVNGNLTINESCTITQIGGNSNGSSGYGGGAKYAGGGGAPVFIYYTGTYVNNGTINTAGGIGSNNKGGDGGAGGIKTTKITT